MNKTIAVIFGGEGAERKISALSAATLIRRAEGSGDLIVKIGISDSGKWYLFSGETAKIEDGSWISDREHLSPTFPALLPEGSGFLSDGGILKVDLAIPILHGDMGEDGVIQGALTCAHIPYVGSDVTSSAISADKAFTKIIAEHLGIPTLPWFLPPRGDMREARRQAEGRLGYPMFIKPRRLGSSIGAAPVYSRRDFAKAYAEACDVSGGLIMIESLAGISEELEVALLDLGERMLFGPGSIRSTSKFYGYEEKYLDTGGTFIDPKPRLGKSLVRKIRYYSRLLSDTLGLGNISRIDFFLTPGGELYFNEINSVPGMTEESLYPKLTETGVPLLKMLSGLSREVAK